MWKKARKYLLSGWVLVSNFDTLLAIAGWFGMSIAGIVAWWVTFVGGLSIIAAFIMGVIVFLCGMLLLTFIAANRESHRQQGIEPIEQPSTNNGISLIGLRERAVEMGWVFAGSDNSHQGDEFAILASQAGLNGEMQFYGKKDDDISEYAKKQLLSLPIPIKHWESFKIEPTRFIYSKDNFSTRTYMYINSNIKGYIDIHVDKDQAERWLIAITEKHKAQTNLVPLPEACTRAYEQTQDTLMSGMAEHESGGDPSKVLNYYACMIVQTFNAILYGAKPPSTLIEEIKDQHFNAREFLDGAERFSLIHGDDVGYMSLAITEKDLHKAIDRIKKGYAK